MNNSSEDRLKPLKTSSNLQERNKATQWQKKEKIMYRPATFKIFQTKQATTKPVLSSLQKRIIGAILSGLFFLGIQILLMKLIFAFI